MIVLDTSVLSLAFRRPKTPGDEPVEAAELRRLIEEDAAVAIPGIVMQELLSGVRSIDQFNQLRVNLAGFRVLVADEEQHLKAADLSNRCRWAGISASTIDCLIASMASAQGRTLFTADKDFQIIAPLCGLKLHG